MSGPRPRGHQLRGSVPRKEPCRSLFKVDDEGRLEGEAPRMGTGQGCGWGEPTSCQHASECDHAAAPKAQQDSTANRD